MNKLLLLLLLFLSVALITRAQPAAAISGKIALADKQDVSILTYNNHITVAVIRSGICFEAK